MWYPHTVTVDPASEPVSLADARMQCHIDSADTAYDSELAVYQAAARAHIEAMCGTPLVERTIEAKCDCFGDFARFPVVPLQEVTAITYLDGEGAEQTLSTDVYEVRTDGLVASIVLKTGQSWPTIQTGSRITVTAEVGYTDIPGDVSLALLLLIGHWFANHEASGKDDLAAIPMGVDALLANRRVWL